MSICLVSVGVLISLSLLVERYVLFLLAFLSHSPFSSLQDGDIERYFDLVDTYNNALSAANSASYTASMDFSSLNANKMDTSLNREDQTLSGVRTT
jgi:hypothetical protein